MNLFSVMFRIGARQTGHLSELPASELFQSRMQRRQKACAHGRVYVPPELPSTSAQIGHCSALVPDDDEAEEVDGRR